MVRATVEEALSAILDAEADEVEVKAPKLRKQTFDSATIERYWRRDISIEEAIV